MRLILPVILMSLIFSSAVLANWNDDLHSVIEPPPAPTTGDSFCGAYEIRNIHCSGDIKIYDQCIVGMSSSTWQQRSENCKAHGEDWYCINNECKQSSTPPVDVNDFLQKYMIYILICAGIVIYYWSKKK